MQDFESGDPGSNPGGTILLSRFGRSGKRKKGVKKHMATIVGSSAGNVKSMYGYEDASRSIAQLDRAAEVSLFFKLPEYLTPNGAPYTIDVVGGQKIELAAGYHAVPHNKGVINLRSGSLAAVTGTEYAILQHGDAFGVSANVVQSLGAKALYRVENDGNVARMEVLFPDIAVKDDTKEGVTLGVRMSNSYDKSCGFHGELFGYRQYCSNGMYSRKLLGEINISARHVGENFINLEKDVLNFVKYVMDSPNVVESVIANAISSKLEFLNTDQIYDTVFDAVNGNMKQAELISAEIPLVTNRWTVFNAFTRYLSHEDITHKTRDDLAVKAENVLMNDSFAPVVLTTHRAKARKKL